ncbi:Mitochondrial glycoprotein [Dillenia turbinata]|uniref:Mitochondrial glycoprotein n=1 Tax=Dillenia turbinata TaxID=194707 RepID=A0AAN8WBG9_9MAGN
MARISTVLRRSSKALKDCNLHKVLQSEIQHELSSHLYQHVQSGSLGDFSLEWDSTRSQDVVLRRKSVSGEEVAVSALLGPAIYRQEGILPREVLMKVCIRKPRLSSLLQFDCGVYNKGDGRSDFDIRKAFYLQVSTSLDPSVYRGPLFSDLDPSLQDALKEYLFAKGVGEYLTNFLLAHLHKKEQDQYVNWLQKLNAMVTDGEDIQQAASATAGVSDI